MLVLIKRQRLDGRTRRGMTAPGSGLDFPAMLQAAVQAAASFKTPGGDVHSSWRTGSGTSVADSARSASFQHHPLLPGMASRHHPHAGAGGAADADGCGAPHPHSHPQGAASEAPTPKSLADLAPPFMPQAPHGYGVFGLPPNAQLAELLAQDVNDLYRVSFREAIAGINTVLYPPPYSHGAPQVHAVWR